MPGAARRYRSTDEDSARWLEFPYRPGDIVISTRSKSGTTWMQMICALLVFGSPTLPGPIAALSPWLDWLTTPLDQVLATLDGQRHRRFVKTHTPLDGVPVDPRATYIVVARHPLDIAVSLYHQGDNINRERMRELIGATEPPGPATPRRPLHEWLLEWIDSDDDPAGSLDSLPGVMWHLCDAWQRRDQPNVLLVHYDDLLADLDGEMRRIAARLDVEIPAGVWPELVAAATFDRMRSRADDLVPDARGILADHRAFFRRGSSGSGREALTPAEVDGYHRRVARLAPADMLAWLHREAPAG